MTALRSAGLVVGFCVVSCLGVGVVLDTISGFLTSPANVVVAMVGGALYLPGFAGLVVMARTPLAEPGSSEASDAFATTTADVRVVETEGLFRIVGHHESFAPLADPPTLWLDAGLVRRLRGFGTVRSSGAGSCLRGSGSRGRASDGRVGRSSTRESGRASFF